jgi:hypothetical protein
MEWYDWVFAFTGVSMAFAAVGMSTLIYAEVRARGADRPGSRRPRRQS